jgi:hypothetical protein
MRRKATRVANAVLEGLGNAERSIQRLREKILSSGPHPIVPKHRSESLMNVPKMKKTTLAR